MPPISKTLTLSLFSSLLAFNFPSSKTQPNTYYSTPTITNQLSLTLQSLLAFPTPILSQNLACLLTKLYIVFISHFLQINITWLALPLPCLPLLLHSNHHQLSLCLCLSLSLSHLNTFFQLDFHSNCLHYPPASLLFTKNHLHKNPFLTLYIIHRPPAP